jgi:hypothetical protein
MFSLNTLKRKEEAYFSGHFKRNWAGKEGHFFAFRPFLSFFTFLFPSASIPK